MYNQELRSCDLEVTQFTLLMALDMTGETNQKNLGKILAMDSTTLTRTLGVLSGRGWIREKPGDDRRQKLIGLTAAGRRKYLETLPQWERAQRKLRARLGDAIWAQMGTVLESISGVEATP